MYIRWNRVKPLLSTTEVAEILDCSRTTVCSYVKTGALRAIRPTPKGRSIKISKEALMRFCEKEVSA